MNPTIGVLITYYNEGPLLRECLDSAFAQGDRPDEVLVYDDASDDPAERYIPSDMPVRVLRGAKNIGLGAARNELLKESRSEFVHFQDADDLFDPRWCEQVRTVLRTTRVDLVLTEISSFLEGQILSEGMIGLARLATDTDFTRFAIEGIIFSPTSTFRREMGLRIGGFRTREILPLCEDFDFHIRLAATGISYLVLPASLISIRIRPESLSRSNGRLKTECLLALLTAIRLTSAELPARYHPHLANAAARFASQLFRAGAYPQAREAFTLAWRLGPPRFAWQRRWYRLVARLLGPMTAERIGHYYHVYLPARVRHQIARLRGAAAVLRNNP
ncbi:MAG: glycosyltransferase family 2 protein [Deltaproteobacteria bacterium]|nr:glycosyltransferase family 2 protein [Deltaproteobacteria bacterium]